MGAVVLWVGLGNMGRGMCKNIVAKAPLDGPLLIYNRSKQRAVDLNASLGPGKTEIIEHLSDGVARADVIFTSLTNDEVVQDVHRAMLADNDVKGKLFVECSTVHPDTMRALAEEAVSRGAEFVAAPVVGPPAVAEAGQLVGILAGPRRSVDRAQRWFKGVTCRAELDLGDQPCSHAATLKVLGNTFVFNAIEQLAEAHVVAEKTGLGPRNLHALVEAVFPNAVYPAYSERMLSGDYHTRQEPLFAVDLARKDTRHAMSLAEGVGVRMHNMETFDAHLTAVKKRRGASGDVAAVYGAMRSEAGLMFENEGS